MEEAVLVCRAPPDRPSSLSTSGSANIVILSVQGDGFSCYEASTQEKLASYALGSAHASFAAPVQRGSHGSYVAAVQPAGGGLPSLVLLQPASKAGGQAAKSILDSQPQIKLPSALHSVHALRAGAGPGGSVAVILADGIVAGADFEHHKLRLLPSGASQPAPRGGARAAAAAAPGRPAATTAAGGCLAVAWQHDGAGSPVDLSFYRAIKTHPFVELLCSCKLPAPAPPARLLSLHLSLAGFVAKWSGGCVSAHSFDYRTGGRRAPNGATFSTEALNKHLGVDPAAADEANAAAGAAAATPAGRKRKAAAAGGGGGAGRLLLCALSDSQLLLAAVTPSASGGAALRHAVLDSRYGCILSAASTQLPIDAGALNSDPSGAQLLPLQAESGRLALEAGGCVFVVSVQPPRADLAGLLGRLAVGGAGTAGPGGAPVSQLARVEGGGGGGEGAVAAAAAAARGRLTSTAYTLDMGPLLAQQNHEANEGGDAAASGAGLALLPTAHVDSGAAEAARESDGLVAAAQRLSELLDTSQKTLGSSGAAAGVDSKKLEAACLQLLQQLQSQAQAQGHPERKQRQRRRRESFAAQQLLGRAAEALAGAGLWGLLQDLLAAQPLLSLRHAPQLLPLAAAAEQHELIHSLCALAEDLPAGALLQSMLHLLGDGGGDAAAGARQHRRHRLHTAAASVLDAASAALAADDTAAGAWLACARAAAAAVDGFSARDACMHPLVAMDVDIVEVRAALQRLPARHVLRLLRYLVKWAGKYSDQPLEQAALTAAAGTAAAASAAGEPGASGAKARRGRGAAVELAPAAPALPRELWAPSWGQVLDWLGALLDAHLAKLAMTPAAAAPLRQLAGCIGGHAAATARLVPLRGVAEHMLAGGELPAAAAAAASSYTVELLDLRVRTQ